MPAQAAMTICGDVKLSANKKPESGISAFGLISAVGEHYGRQTKLV